MPTKLINIRSPRPANNSTQPKATSRQSHQNLVDRGGSTNTADSDDDQLLKPSEVADILDVSVKTLARWNLIAQNRRNDLLPHSG